jgi:hypothetical protein
MEKKYVLAAAGVLVAAVLGIAATQESGNRAAEAGDWRSVMLTDVSTGESFSVGELEKPVLVETFAVWCPTCTRQQKEVAELKQSSEVTSVSLDTDPNEDAEKIRSHLERHGFDWRYAVAPPEATRSLAEQYGSSVLNPPSAPMVLVCENSTRRLPDGVKSAEELRSQVERGC